MALVTPVEIAALCRVSIPDLRSAVASYEFANGFDTSTPAGAVNGSPAIYRYNAGRYFLFLHEAVDRGSLTQQGGAVIEAISTRVSNTPSILLASTMLAADLSATPYAGVDPERVIGVCFYDTVGAAYTDPSGFTVKVYRNPVTIIQR